MKFKPQMFALIATCCLGGCVKPGPLGLQELPDFAELVERNRQAVVNISASKTPAPNPESQPRPEGEPPFGELFERFFGDPENRIDPFNSDSFGSGFVISEDGYLLTNYHVVEDAEVIVVRLHDRRELEAKVVGHDQRSDLAVLKVDASDLATVQIGSTQQLRVGEWVLAIGSPFGFDYTVTQGIVSAKGRSLPNENYVPFIQTDVAINPGNSGGPLFNLEGEVIGVNAQIYSRTGGFMGLSFAIPIEVAMDVAQQLRTTGSVRRGWLGVVIQEVTRELAQSFGMDKAEGALVSRVLPESPAFDAGIEVGDIILKYNQQTVIRSAALPPLVGRTGIGQVADVEVLRNGNLRQLRVEIGELPSQQQLAEAASSPAEDTSDPSASGTALGLKVVPANSKLLAELGIEDGGVLVAQVDEGPAAIAGVQAGDVIVMLDNQTIKDVASFNHVAASLEAGRSVAILVQRQEGPIFLALQVGETE